MLKLNRFLFNLKVKIQDYLFKNNEYLFQYSTKDINENFRFFRQYFFTHSKHLNFIITSTAEVRVFSPIIYYLIKNSSLNINIVFLLDFRFENKLLESISKSNKLRLTTSTLPLVFSLRNPNYINVICLDFINEKWHKLGVDIITYLKDNKAKTLCIQHGGSQNDNIVGHSNSVSTYQIVYGKKIFESLLDLGLNKNKVYLTGNPLHDHIKKIKINIVKDKLKKENFIIDKKIILIATCLFAEYDDRENSNELYIKYIRVIYDNLDFEKYKVIVKMHPNDKVEPNLYLEGVNNEIDSNKLKIIFPNNKDFTFYELATVSDLIISRSSTVIEEGIFLGKKVISFDLFKDGPSNNLSHLNTFFNYKQVIYGDGVLKNTIEELINNGNSLSYYDKAIELFTYKLDGKSNERIKDALLDILKKQI
jgi:hypothetical protein